VTRVEVPQDNNDAAPVRVSAAAVPSNSDPASEKGVPRGDQEEVSSTPSVDTAESFPASGIFGESRARKESDNPLDLAKPTAPRFARSQDPLQLSYIDLCEPRNHTLLPRHPGAWNGFKAADCSNQFVHRAESPAATEVAADREREIEEPWTELEHPWPELPPSVQPELPTLHRALLLRQDQERAEREQRGG